jgi:porin
VTGRLAVTVPVKMAGRTAYHTLTVVASSKTGTNLADIPELLLPPESGATLGTKQGSYYVGYSVQQYLWEDAHTPGAGWGVFGQVGFSDSNPNPFAWMVLAGLGGSGLIPGRRLDRFGVAYFRYAFSDQLTDGLRLFGLNIGDEHGGELFYNAAVTPWFRLTGDLQIIAPGSQRRDPALFTGLRAHLQF